MKSLNPRDYSIALNHILGKIGEFKDKLQVCEYRLRRLQHGDKLNTEVGTNAAQ